MIAPLRRLHRWIFVVLAILLPVLVVLALGARSTVPDSEGPPSPASSADGSP